MIDSIGEDRFYLIMQVFNYFEELLLKGIDYNKSQASSASKEKYWMFQF